MWRVTCRDVGHVYWYGYGSQTGDHTHLQVESNSSVLVDMVTGKCNINENVPTLIPRIRD
jgi:hypothetical protein